MALALSPHLDDAAFSCGGTLARLAQAGWQVTVVTAFTASVADPQGFALECQRDKGLPDAADYMALRRAEDLTACAALGVVARHLAFAEAPHRGYHSVAALFGAVRPEDHIHLALAAALADLPRADLWLLPQAIGGHVDHLQLRHAAALAKPAATPVLHWQDWPYASRPASHPGQCQHLPILTVTGDAAARQAACAAYATQLGFQFGGAGGLAAALEAAGPTETFRLEGSLPALWPA